MVYLDHAGATLYARSQVEQGANALLSRVVSNPHSTAGGGDGLIQQARRAVLAHFNVNERTHRVVWTSGATHALRLVAECFPWTAGHSRLRMMLDNHTSVLGMRQMASELGGACVEAVESVEEVHEWECRGKASGGDRGDGQRGEEDELVYHLLAYPGESNFSGVRYDLDLARRYHEARGDKWLVLLDAAKLAATAPLDLTELRGQFDVLVNAKGGGLTGQAEAIQLGIARCLVQFNEELRKPLRDAGYMTRDPRMVERKKPGQPKARKKFQFSKR